MVDIFTNIYMYYIVKSFCLTEYLSVIKGKYDVLNKIMKHRACSFKRKAYCQGGKCEKMREAWRHSFLHKRKPKAAEEFSQRIAQQYSYDLELELH